MKLFTTSTASQCVTASLTTSSLQIYCPVSWSNNCENSSSFGKVTETAAQVFANCLLEVRSAQQLNAVCNYSTEPPVNSNVERPWSDGNDKSSASNVDRPWSDGNDKSSVSSLSRPGAHRLNSSRASNKLSSTVTTFNRCSSSGVFFAMMIRHVSSSGNSTPANVPTKHNTAAQVIAHLPMYQQHMFHQCIRQYKSLRQNKHQETWHKDHASGISL